MIKVYPDLESLSRAAAALLVEQANLAVAARGRFSVALSGGNTPRRTYELLAAPPFKEQAPWHRMHIFWGDERCVPLTDPRSNARMTKETWLEHVPIPESQIHFLDCAQAPAEAARQYEAQLRQFFAGRPPRLDLVLLGLGDNGHTASLFPNHPVLTEDDHLAVPVRLGETEHDRISLTLPVINRAAAVFFLVTGKPKAAIIRRILEEREAGLPASLVNPTHGEVLFLLDRGASSLLSKNLNVFAYKTEWRGACRK